MNCPVPSPMACETSKADTVRISRMNARAKQIPNRRRSADHLVMVTLGTWERFRGRRERKNERSGIDKLLLCGMLA